MDFPMYDNARKLVKRPHDAYLSHLQALINERWENSTQTIFSVYQQADIGSDEWIEQPISIDTAIDIGTGFKKGDDFKVFSHKNISADMKLVFTLTPRGPGSIGRFEQKSDVIGWRF